MTDLVTVNRDKTRLLPPNAAEKGWRISRKEAVKLGLLDSDEKPIQRRRVNSESNGTPQKRRSSTKGLNRGLNEDA